MDSILNKKSHAFLAQYLNNPAPTGYEWESQKNLDELSKALCR